MKKFLLSLVFWLFIGINFAQEKNESIEFVDRLSFGETRLTIAKNGSCQLENGVKILLPSFKNGNVYMQELAHYQCVYFVAVHKRRKQLKNTVFIYSLDGVLLDKFKFKGQLKIEVKRKKLAFLHAKKNKLEIDALVFSTLGEKEIVRAVFETNGKKIVHFMRHKKRKLKRFIRRKHRKGLLN